MSLPVDMIAVTAPVSGGPEALIVSTHQCPRPAKGQVLIKVAAAGVNRPDISQREGRYPVPKDASPILGLEVSGHIAALGEGVTAFSEGDAVSALVHGGGYAEYALADVGTVLLVPEGLPIEDAAALPEVAFTVELNLIQRANLQKGEIALVHGGSSGIGSHAIRRAIAAGAQVFVTAGSDEKCAWCKDLGADLAINYRETRFDEAVLEATDGRGVDVILDMVGGQYVDLNLKALANDGRCAVISLQGGRQIAADFEALLRRRLTLVGATLRPLPPTRKAQLAQDVRENVWPLITQGLIRPQIRKRFALGDVAEAHRAMEARDHMGKIILTTGAE